MMAQKRISNPMIGATVASYRIVEQLGIGGMGVIYRAEDTRLGRSVALKFLPPELTHRSEAKDRFLQEAKAASALDHPNICTIYQIAETEAGQLFIAMACYEGESLRDRMARGPLSEGDALDILRQVASGLAESHCRDIVHRDIKPANLWCTRSGLVKILDFGLAKVMGQVGLTRTGSSMGTPAYMSPEQTRGERVDARSDLWSLGVVIYEALCGRLPFDGKNVPSILYAIHAADPHDLGTLRPDLSPAFVALVHRLLDKSPAARPQEAGDLLVELDALRETVDGSSMEMRRTMPPVDAPMPLLTPPPSVRKTRVETPSAGARFDVSPPGGVRPVDPTAAVRRPAEATVLLPQPLPARPTPTTTPAVASSSPAASGAAVPSMAKSSGPQAGDYEGWMARGIGAALARDYPRAIDSFEKALAIRPGDRRAQFNLRRLRP